MVAEAEKYEMEDKAVMARVEARNAAEAYLYNARNTVQEERVKAALPDADRAAVEDAVKAGLEWLDENRDAHVEAVQTKQKEWEEVIRPVLMKLYATGGTEGSSEATEGGAAAGPRVEEVD
jgi:heat shock protein 5